MSENDNQKETLKDEIKHPKNDSQIVSNDNNFVISNLDRIEENCKSGIQESLPSNEDGFIGAVNAINNYYFGIVNAILNTTSNEVILTNSIYELFTCIC